MIVLYRRQSSAKNRTLEVTGNGKSLMYEEEGPRTVPCGIPDTTGTLLDVPLSIG